MARPHSLRTTLVVGLALLHVLVVGAVAATVWAHARREAHEALRGELRFRAQTIAGLVELTPEGVEFEGSEKTMPEYAATGTSAWTAVYDADGKAVVRSPSLRGGDLPPSVAWEEGGCAFDEMAEGPGGVPCLRATLAFVVAAEPASPSNPGWVPPTEAARRYHAVVAQDSRPRDARLARFATFLTAISSGALVVTVAGGFLLARRVLAPIRRMTEEAARLTPEDTARRLRPETLVQELISLSQTLNSALDRLGNALDRQRRVASDASHELRTPLAVLRSNAEFLLRRERSAEEYRAGLERQRRVLVRLTEITENLLALARADSGDARLRRTRVVLRDVASGVCDEFASIAEDSRVALDCDADASVAVDGDPAYLAGVVQNLVANAVKFTPEGGSVRVGVRRDETDAVLDVADTGPGIPEPDRERVWERFFRVRGGRDRREGAGLGLAIVDWIVRAHGGSAEIHGREGGGTVFRIRLPLAT
jgi:heavy metal sensor kinase